MSFGVCSGVFMPCSALPTLHNAGAGAQQFKVMAVTAGRMQYHKQDEKGGSEQRNGRCAWCCFEDSAAIYSV